MRSALAVERHQQVCQWVESMCVAAVLRDEHLRRELTDEWWHHCMERAQPSGVTGARGKRDVDRRAASLVATGLVREAGAREQRAAGLVQADRQHAWVVPERRLHAIAVMHVDVDVRDPLDALAQQPCDGDRRVVVDAEARSGRRHRVVQAACDVARMLMPALMNGACRRNGCTGYER